MPIYRYACPICANHKEALVPHASMRTHTEPCTHAENCDGVMVYDGLCAPIPGREQVFGLIMNDGRRVRGTMLKGHTR